MNISDLTIAVCCNKNDFFMARICIASIRYYYSEIPVEIVKDTGNGKFNTKELERYFNVTNIDIGIEKLGWSGAKFHYLYQMPEGKKVLLLDADIVFIGPFLKRLLPLIEQNDYVVSIDKETNPYAEWVKKDYFDTKKIEAYFPLYKYPGYFFNAGQIFVTTGSIDKNILNNYFNPHNYPYWKNKELFPAVDQSVYNYLLPTLSAQNKLKLATAEFMLWSKSKAVKNISLNKIKNKETDAGLIHWAGDAKNPLLKYMTRGDILKFFEKEYFKRIKYSKIKIAGEKAIPLILSKFRIMKRAFFN